MLSDWASKKSDGTLPLDKYAHQFQYRHFIHWNVDLTGFGIAPHFGTGTWHIQFVTEDDSVVFEQTVSIKLTLVSLGFIGLQLFTWYFTEETITTTIVDGTPITVDNPAWKYTLGGTSTSEFGTFVPGGGSDMTNISAIIDAFWESPVYKMNMAPGIKLKVIMDSWGLGIASRPEWQFRFQYGLSRLTDCKAGPYGELDVIFPENSTANLYLGHGFGNFQIPFVANFLEGMTDPSIIIMPDGRRLYGVCDVNGYWEFESHDVGLTATRMQYNTKDFRVKQYAAIFPRGVVMPQLTVSPISGKRFALGVVDNNLLIRTITDNGPEDVWTLVKNVGDDTYAIDIDNSGTIYVIDNSGVPVFTSKDNGLSWRQPVVAS